MSLSVSPFVRRSIDAIRRLYPQSLADSSWDNTGLLLESPASSSSKDSILLTVDLTTPVADEAIANNHAFIIAYHPIIFRPLKSLTLEDSQQRTLLRLVQNGISVYCPHTAIDAAVGGVNDWLVEAISRGSSNEISRIPLIPNNPTTGTAASGGGSLTGTGMGRLVELVDPIPLGSVIQSIKNHLGLAQVQIALSAYHRKDVENVTIKTAAVCAGSGGSVLKGTKSDLYLTGEMSHHELLAATAQGISVIVCNHSNTERGFLSDVLRHQLIDEMGDGTNISLSTQDRDPLQLV